MKSEQILFAIMLFAIWVHLLINMPVQQILFPKDFLESENKQRIVKTVKS